MADEIWLVLSYTLTRTLSGPCALPSPELCCAVLFHFIMLPMLAFKAAMNGAAMLLLLYVEPYYNNNNSTAPFKAAVGS